MDDYKQGFVVGVFNFIILFMTSIAVMWLFGYRVHNTRKRYGYRNMRLFDMIILAQKNFANRQTVARFIVKELTLAFTYVIKNNMDKSTEHFINVIITLVDPKTLIDIQSNLPSAGDFFKRKIKDERDQLDQT